MTRRALFLDRDGVINVDDGHVHSIHTFFFVPGIFDVLRHAQNLGYILIVVTNQAGIARGFYSEEEFFELDEWMKGQFRLQGITISRTYYCPHHPEAGVGVYLQDCECRKPKPGMLLRAERDFGISFAQSILVGDKNTDIEAGIRAGVGRTILFRAVPDLLEKRLTREEAWSEVCENLVGA